MGVKKRSIVLLLVVSIAFLFFASCVRASTPGNVTACQTLDTNGTYTLNRSLISENVSLGLCFNITSRNIILDCQGNWIRNDTASIGGILTNASNTTIKNCNINMSAGYGIYLNYSDNSTVSNSTINQAGQGGIQMNYVLGAVLQGLSFVSDSGGAVSLLASNYTRMANATLSLSGSTIGLTYANFNNFSNITISGINSGPSSKPISLSISNNNTFSFINTTGNANGIQVSGIGNSFSSIVSSYNSNGFGTPTYGLYLNGAHYTSVVNLSAVSNQQGLFVDASSANNTVFNSSLVANNRSIRIDGAGNNTFTSVYLINSTGDGLFISPGSGLSSNSMNNVFTNLTFVNTNNSFYDVRILIADSGQVQPNGTIFIDTEIRNYSLAMAFNGVGGARSNGMTLTLRKTLFGEISFVSAINGTGTNLSGDLFINNNTVLINGTVGNNGLNNSANITLYGLPTNFANPAIYRDGSACGSDVCTALTSLNNGNPTFSVTGGGNYTIVDVPSSSGGTTSSSSGGGGGGGSINQFTVSSQDLTTGYSHSLYRGDRYRFTLGSSNHTVTLTTFNRTSATVTVASTPQTVALVLGVPKIVDVDPSSDSLIRLVLESVTSSTANIRISLVAREAETPQAPIEPTSTNQPPKKSFPYSWIIVIVIALAAGAAYYLFTRKRKK